MMIVGIDPDNKKSGVAVYQNASIGLHSLSIAPLVRRLEHYKDEITMVYLEAGWLNNAIHHAAPNSKVKANIGVRVGVNFGYGKVIENFLQEMNIPYKLIRPSKKTPKLNQHQFKAVTGYSKRSNQEERDAAMLIWRGEGLSLSVLREQAKKNKAVKQLN